MNRRRTRARASLSSPAAEPEPRHSGPRASDGASRTSASITPPAEEETLIAPKPTPNAAQLVIVGLSGESRRTVGLEVARVLGRPFTDGNLLPCAPDESHPDDAEVAAARRALGGATRIVLACSVKVFDVDAGASSVQGSHDRTVDRSGSAPGREVAEHLGSAWVVWIDRQSTGDDESGNGIEIEGTSEEQRRRAERWADMRIEADELSHDELIGSILDAWSACPDR